MRLGDIIEKIGTEPVAEKTFEDIVKSFVGPVSTRLYLTVTRDGERLDVAVVRHNRLTTAYAQSSLQALHERMSAMTICVPWCVPAGASAPAEKENAAADIDKSPSKAATACSEALGLDLRAVNGDWLVERVHCPGPAEGAGLVAGDVLLQVDAIPLQNTKGFDVLWALDGPAAPELASLAVQSRLHPQTRFVAVTNQEFSS